MLLLTLLCPLKDLEKNFFKEIINDVLLLFCYLKKQSINLLFGNYHSVSKYSIRKITYIYIYIYICLQEKQININIYINIYIYIYIYNYDSTQTYIIFVLYLFVLYYIFIPRYPKNIFVSGDSKFLV